MKEAIVKHARPEALTDKQTLVCELLLLAEREVSVRAQLITAVTVMEVLVHRSERTGQARRSVDKFIEEVASQQDSADEDGDRQELGSLLGGLRDLRRASISTSVRRMAIRSRHGDPEVEKLARRIYQCRSDLVHAGVSRFEDATISNDARSLAQDMFRLSLTE
jgi:hypothetical protein